MKNKLYLFGGSFAWSPKDNRAWPTQLATDLDYVLVNKGFPGYSILKAFHDWKDLEKDMQEGDITIICLTSLDRSYTYQEVPYYSQLIHATDSPKILDAVDKTIAKKIKNLEDSYINYHMNFHNPTHVGWFVQAWLRWLEIKSKDLKSKTIILPDFVELLPFLSGNFKNVIISNKPTFEICQEEYDNAKYEEVFNRQYDCRSNHLCFDNHKVLIKKLKNVLRNIDVDWHSDWHQGLINDFNIKDPNWHLDQFCPAKFDEKFFYDENIYDKIIDHCRYKL